MNDGQGTKLDHGLMTLGRPWLLSVTSLTDQVKIGNPKIQGRPEMLLQFIPRFSEEPPMTNMPQAFTILESKALIKINGDDPS